MRRCSSKQVLVEILQYSQSSTQAISVKIAKFLKTALFMEQLQWLLLLV